MITRTVLLGSVLGFATLFAAPSYAHHHAYPSARHVKVDHFYHSNYRSYAKFRRWAPPRNYVVIRRPVPFWFGHRFW
ncbi:MULTISPECIES: hypothetical protein [Legionella]|uniref:Transmembrane protein n=1 Tax=Legionella drozanskii LLAP-1 TaxID=1212489 RepID=A0A0W0SVZ0_9GAMM|nr:MULTISPECIES: hypothetical protein [Legionella]KTC87427.1 hypothetical protein Ldro_1046 [Legionella drozanskii LLAP-1]PJE17502.1 MAG: hypothetical protein CK430_02250 [Legionella sp.]